MLTYSAEQPNTSYGQLILSVGLPADRRTIAAIEEARRRPLPDSMIYGRRFVLGPGGGSKIEIRFRGRTARRPGAE